VSLTEAGAVDGGDGMRSTLTEDVSLSSCFMLTSVVIDVFDGSERWPKSWSGTLWVRSFDTLIFEGYRSDRHGIDFRGP
jgi:hypothetical protein